MESNSSKENYIKLCKICDHNVHKYLCPRCGIEYCSVVCYKSDKHSECSESFYRGCVEEELKFNEKDPETRRKMLEILQRMHEEHANDMEDMEELAHPQLDSDDDDEVPDLSDRLRNIDLDDADSVWAALTDGEKQEFETLLCNGEMEKLLPPWKPWWSYRANAKLVEDLSKTSKAFDYQQNCPRIKNIKHYNEISKVPPAECVKNNVLNVLHAYAFTALYFNGDHHNFPREAISILTELSNNLRENEVFIKADLAIESVSQQAMNCRTLVADTENISATKNACTCILQGPEDSNKYFYVKAAFSDLHKLFSKCTVPSKPKDTPKCTSKEFSKRFPDHGAISATEIPRNKLKLYLKKIEYYLSWVDTYGSNLYT
ncbi:zinc finger HIT domain-containing protein 2 isoform X1 [Neodiprion virginianus]|uniref:zinc finger HIT domain-containing protein 2 isoform X1 n=2 Tax=Neodiprion virginianus TaxID=2961670 RepID=UPI001EE6A629|nr:zinc finger HIT domain-containing protein 2 isoform X1 [Neodiprion virginianus]